MSAAKEAARLRAISGPGVDTTRFAPVSPETPDAYSLAWARIAQRCGLRTRDTDFDLRKFYAEPFERGFGVTVGNSLRRILLSSLEGSAVTQIKIRGAQHEFSTIPGVLEDVTDIVLNVKSLVVKNHTESTKVITVEKQETGAVTGADVEADADVEIINKDHVLATLTDNVPFMMEMVVENGRGYVPSTEHSSGEHEIGIIPIDAVFSPITRVRYEVEETRVGQKTNYDKLTLEIWTNGSVHPEMALVESAKILRKHLNPFVQYVELGPKVHSQPRSGSGSADAALEQKLNLSLAELKLSVRASNCLESENINTVRDLVSHTEDQLLEVRNFGDTTLNEVKEKLTELGMHLGMRVPPAQAAASSTPAGGGPQTKVKSDLMRHRRRGRKLGRSPSHRRAMLRNLASSLFLTERRTDEPDEDGTPKVKGRVVTTLHKAKEVRPLVERCITIARRSLEHADKAKQFEPPGDRGSEAWKQWRTSKDWQEWCAARAPVVAARRHALRLLGDKEAVHILFSDVAPRFSDRHGGYTRVIRLATPRLGDAGERAILEFVGVRDRIAVKSEKPAFADDAPADDAPADSPAADDSGGDTTSAEAEGEVTASAAADSGKAETGNPDAETGQPESKDKAAE